MQALGFCFFWAKPKERAPRWRRTEARLSEGQENSDRIKIPVCAGMTDLLVEESPY